MTVKGINQNGLKISNRSKVLRILRQGKSVSRKDISDKTGLTKAAISGIVSEMIEENIVIEKGSRETGTAGRKKIILELNKKYGYVLGVSITDTHLICVIANVLGETIDVLYHELEPDQLNNMDNFVDLIIEKSFYILWKNSYPRDCIMGIGIGYIGSLDEIKIGVIEDSIRQRLHIPVLTVNNVKALAMSQMDLYYEETSENFLFVKYGPGLGMSIVRNGSIIDGVDNKAGEIGHTIVDINAKTTCRCGRSGCLESLSSEKGIIKEIEALGDKYNDLIIDKSLTIIDYEKVNRYIKANDKKILDIFEPRYNYFAKALANSVILFNPEYVSLYGNVFSQPELFEMISNLVNTYLGPKTKVIMTLSNLDPRNSAIGPASYALRELFYHSGGYQ
jgi:predicted NBD/HSP70 family sugar kinase